MTLREWLNLTGTRQTALAQKLGITPTSVGRILTDQQLPSRDLMRRIFEVTGGAVTPNDIIGVRMVADRAPPAATRQTEV